MIRSMFAYNVKQHLCVQAVGNNGRSVGSCNEGGEYEAVAIAVEAAGIVVETRRSYGPMHFKVCLRSNIEGRADGPVGY